MSLLKGNYPIEAPQEPEPEEKAPNSILEKEYYRAALTKLGGSICFVMKAKTFLWTGEPEMEKIDGHSDTKTPSSQEEESIKKEKKN